MKKPLKVLILSSSKRIQKSRSRLGLKYIYEDLVTELEKDGKLGDVEIEFEFVDLHKILKQPKGLSSPDGKALIKSFQQADGWILGSPVYNWQGDPDLLIFLNEAIDSDKIASFKPLILIGAGGSLASVNCLYGIVRGMTQELNAIVIGKPYFILPQSTISDGGMPSEKDSGSIRLVEEVERTLSSYFDAFIRVLLASPKKHDA